MASKLTSEITYSYHVFLSFRGEDTRKTFTGHIYAALIQAGFRTFLDDDGLPKGENLKSEISKAISESKCSIVIMSSGYSSSRWCLDELVMILDQKRRNGHMILPVYYDVEPTQVRNQTGKLGEAFAPYDTQVEHETDSTRKMELVNKIKQWRGALREVADLAGMVLKDQVNGQESKFIKKIVQVISEKLNRKGLSMAPYLVGMESRIKKINLWLQDESTDASILIISGIGGIGKTTIAKSVYNLNFQRFEGSSYLANVRETSMQPYGLVRLQRQLLSDILKTKSSKINNVDEGAIKIRDLLQCKRLFLILDDVDRADQLDAVIGMRNWFCQGSKIIITTRNKRLLEVNKTCEMQGVQELDNKESLQLFCMHAFGQGNPSDDYLNLSQQIVRLCGGLPLALQVIGSSLSRKSLDVWRSALRKLELFPDSQVVNKLQISYDALQDDHDKDLFLHIACFFIGKDKDFAKSVLDACGFYTAVGIESLMDSYLLEIDETNKLAMHQLLRDMARDIVRRESPKEPGKRSRLWHHQDSLDVLSDKTGTESLEGLCLDMHVLQNQKFAEEHGSSSKKRMLIALWHPASTSSRERHAKVLKISAFERMHKLRVLLLNQVEFTGNFKKFPKGLRWLEWFRYPHTSIPREFPLGELVALDLRYSNLNVFKGSKVLGSLKYLNLGHSHSLSRTPDFKFLPSLEILILKDCIGLSEIDESIGCLHNLLCLDLEGCKNLSKLPENIGMLISLEELVISGCTKVDNLATKILKLDSLKVLRADGTDLSQLSSTNEDFRLGESQIFGLWKSQLYLPKFLVTLSLVDCNLSEIAFPGDFGNLNLLQNLDLSKNPIQCLPDSIRRLRSLDVLKLDSCARLKSLLRLPTVQEVYVTGCSSLQKITYRSPYQPPKSIFHTGCKQLSEVDGLLGPQPYYGMTNDIWNCIHMKNVQFDYFYNPGCTRTKLPDQIIDRRCVVSTFLPRRTIPSGVSMRSTRTSMSFQITIECNMRIRQVQIFCTYTLSKDNKEATSDEQPFVSAKIINKSKNLTWSFRTTCVGFPVDNEEMSWFSYWRDARSLAMEDKNTVEVEVALTKLLKFKELGIRPIYEQYVPDNTSIDYSSCIVRSELTLHKYVKPRGKWSPKLQVIKKIFGA